MIRSLLLVAVGYGAVHAADPPSPTKGDRNINSVRSDLTVPAVVHEAPAPGKRVCVPPIRSAEDKLRYALYLPVDWEKGKTYPLLVEFPPNGGYSNALGDATTGEVADCRMGFGLSGGSGMIWLSLPFRDRRGDHARQWWGDADRTAEHAESVVLEVQRQFGGDPKRTMLMGFSRGAIACNYIGLRNDRIAKLWCGLFPHSHYDGVRKWNYADADAESARKRLARLGDRPQLISDEAPLDPTRRFLTESRNRGTVEYLPLTYPNHSADWLLKDIPERKSARAWVDRVFAEALKK